MPNRLHVSFVILTFYIVSNDIGIFAFLKAQPIGFNTRVDRFREEEQKKTALGPGSYNPPTDSLQRHKQKHQTKAEWQQMAMVRLPGAPSIPSHNNIFGYEETASLP